MAEGKRIAGYVLERPIGSGGMGEVWLAQHEVLGRPTVLKKLKKELASVDEIVTRFEREARTASHLHERQIVSVYDAFRHRGELYIAQEYVEGADLRTILNRIEHLPPRLMAFIALELARALEAIHRAGTVHRDLKPSNLLVSREGDVKVADFGIALEQSGPDLTQLGAVIGTPAYMAPEQLCGERADPRSDLFAFGAICYEMLTGKPPYPDTQTHDAPAAPNGAQDEATPPPRTDAAATESRLSRMQKERYLAPRRVRKEIPRRLARIVRSCLRTKPSRRIASAAELRFEFEAYTSRMDVTALRAELASYLWDRGVFVRRDDETVVRVSPPQLIRQRRSPTLRRVAIAACLVIAVASLGLVAYSPKERLPDRVAALRTQLTDWLKPPAQKPTDSTHKP